MQIADGSRDRLPTNHPTLPLLWSVYSKFQSDKNSDTTPAPPCLLIFACSTQDFLLTTTAGSLATSCAMASERSLNNLLQHYQDVHDVAKTEQIIGTTTYLLTELSNPLNISLLTSHFLTAPAIWRRHNGLKTSLRIISVFNTAAVRVREYEKENTEGKGPRQGGGLGVREWARTVIKGVDDGSRRWQHLLVMVGVLMGTESNDRMGLSRGLRNTVEQAVVTAANLALETYAQDGSVAAASIVMSLNFAFPLLSDHHKTAIHCNLLLPLTILTLTGNDGFGDTHFLHAIARDTFISPSGVFVWTRQSPSSQFLQELEQSPLMANMGPLSKLAAFAAQHATDTRIVLQAHDAMLLFTQNVLACWSTNPFSDIDPASESLRLGSDTLHGPWESLWLFLRKLMFGVVVVLQGIVSRSLLDPNMLSDAVSPGLATKTLQILRNLFFISNRNGNSAFQVYDFTYLTSLDIVSRSPAACERLLVAQRPAEASALPTGHLQRTLDLFYLNVAEHLPLALSTDSCETLIIKPATQYLSEDGVVSPAMVEIFESAHSAILSVLSCPQHSQLTIKIAPFYIVKVLESFPNRISPRQFRVAFKTVMQIVSPPFPIAAMAPHLSEALLEMLRFQAANASTAILPLKPSISPTSTLAASREEPGTEQSSLTLALIDSLPFLPLPLVEDWLTVAAQTMNGIANPSFREPVKKRFWDMLVSGEMDAERAAIGVAWWSTKGGRELVLFGGREPALMSGAIVNDPETSRL